MTIGRLLLERVDVVRMGAATDPDYGNEIYSETSREAGVPAYLEQLSGRELEIDRGTELADWRIVLPAGTAIDAKDRIEWGAYTFEVQGPPQRPRRPRGEHHVEVRARHIEP